MDHTVPECRLCVKENTKCVYFYGMTLVCTNGTLIYSYRSDVNLSAEQRGKEFGKICFRKG